MDLTVLCGCGELVSVHLCNKANEKTVRCASCTALIRVVRSNGHVNGSVKMPKSSGYVNTSVDVIGEGDGKREY